MKRLMPLIITFTLFMGIWWVYGAISSTSKTTVALIGTYEEAFNGDAVIIRDEYPLKTDAKGKLQSVVANGQRVGRTQTVAYLFAGDIDRQAQQEVQRLARRIEEMEASLGSADIFAKDAVAVSRRIAAIAADVSLYGSQGKGQQVSRMKMDINMMLDKKNATGNGQADLEKLKAQKSEAEKRLGSRSSLITASHSGTYFDSTDGYEEVLHIRDMQNLRIADIESVLANKGKRMQDASPYAVCKTVDSSQWVAAIVTSAENAAGMKDGTAVSLRMTGEGVATVQGTVLSISEQEDNKVLIGIAGSHYVNNIFSNRIVNVDVIRKTYKGFKLPATALCKVDGKDVVYIVRPGGESVRNVQVIFRSEDTVIAKEDNKCENGLLLYDEVIVSPKKNKT